MSKRQRDANGRFGFSAKTTLSLAQALYEKHKVLTYPRTDSRHLPEDYPATVRKPLDVLGNSAAYGSFARRIATEEWVRPALCYDGVRPGGNFAARAPQGAGGHGRVDPMGD